MKVKVLVSLDVTACESGDIAVLEANEVSVCVLDAIRNAIGYGESVGHVHDMADRVSILMERASVVSIEGTISAD